ncbi:MAG TPA: aminotransferase class III-fold pyridoxal phosphate-dependent enzyme [Solirubrobacteraceae bacterium]|nr:aminotransferase class III-fold pyridoxal phosphate-dependent enzyme [Solirubrobacteraceae bacterium]
MAAVTGWRLETGPFAGRSVPDVRHTPPGPRSAELLERQRAVMYPGFADHVAPFVMSRKHGWVVEDLDENLYLDMASASASVPLGAGREETLEPAIAALRRYGNEDTHAIPSELVAPLAERLLDCAPPNLSRVDIALNGTEAVETAVRVMRRATGRPLILGFLGGYHGETTTTATLGAEAAEIGHGARHLSPGFVHVPFPNPYRTPFAPPRVGGTGNATVDFIADHLLFHAIDPSDVAGVMIEPVLGSGGVIAPPDTFWRALTDLCRRYGWLLCLDEVKTGLGRTGTMFAAERWDLRPDLMCLGKGLGGGVMPIGALLGTEEALGGFDDLSTGSTWSWLPGACAAALATLDALQAPGVLDHVRAIERTALERFGALAGRFENLGDVRAAGCLIALELVRDRTSKERATELQEALARECLNRGLLADSSTTSYNIQPSLVTPLGVIEVAAQIVESALETVLAGAAARGAE